MFCRVLAPFLLASAFLSSVVAQTPTQVAPSTLGTVSRAPEFTDEASAFQAAEDFYAAKNYESALSTYKRFLKAYPSSKLASKAQLQIADILLIQGRWNASFDAYQTLITRYPDTPEFEGAVARQVLIANSYLDMKKVMVLGYGVPVPGITGIEKAAKMYETILKNAPYSIYAPITQFNLGLAFRARKEDQGSARILSKSARQISQRAMSAMMLSIRLLIFTCSSV